MQALSLDVTVTHGAGRTVRVVDNLEYGDLAVVRAGPADGAALARAVVVEPPAAGHVKVRGTDVREKPPTTREIGYVPAGGGLLPHRTLRGNIAYGLRWRADVPAWDATERVEVAGERLGLTLALGLYPHEVTDEERLRAALARAAVTLPQVLIVHLPRAQSDGAGDGRVDGGAEPVDLPGLLRTSSLSDLEVTALVLTDHPGVLRQTRSEIRLGIQVIRRGEPEPR